MKSRVVRTDPGVHARRRLDDELLSLLAELQSLRAKMVRTEGEAEAGESEKRRKSRCNLRHYLTLRRRDIRPLQERLSRLGLSSLGRCEAHTLASVDSVLDLLVRLTGKPIELAPSAGAPTFDEGRALLEGNADALFGPRPKSRSTRIMVTLSTDAAERPELVEALLEAGTDIVRINCAHDDPRAWAQMVANVRGAGKRLGRAVAVHMDLGGPKLRTVVGSEPVVLSPGDSVLLVKSATVPSSGPNSRGGKDKGKVSSRSRIACTIPGVLDMVRAGEPVWFDDGKLGGIVDEVGAEGALLRITYARHGRRPLQSDRGINFPESLIDIPSFTPQDREDLDFIAYHADCVGLSFAQRVEDVRAVQERLAELGERRLGLILKIETRAGFQALPRLLYETVGRLPLGVMIARGDLAIEIGYERLAEVQEEILWICEAAHVPVIWATQVLESLSKHGMPTRAEITDAAMAERAECVMLNKGKHIVDTVRILDGILGRMAAHQRKKSATLRALGVSRATK
ncbi:MAG TPA: pyruvate kinase [Polyangiaceae bacterium]|nr:pyruvate kinase [Polyangiaceae bacterium]